MFREDGAAKGPSHGTLLALCYRAGMAFFDFSRLKAELVTAGEHAFRAMRANHPTDHFYCMGLYTSGAFGYVVPTAMTEEGLDEAVAAYGSGTDRIATRLKLRWMPCDSPLHLECEEMFDGVQPHVSEVAAVLSEIDTSQSWEEFDDFWRQVENVLCEVLGELDRRGVFGRGAEREALFVTVLMGDQDGSVLAMGRRLNARGAVARFQAEWALGALA